MTLTKIGSGNMGGIRNVCVHVCMRVCACAHGNFSYFSLWWMILKILLVFVISRKSYL